MAGQREICLWLDSRWYDALKKHLGCEPEERLNEYLDELINQLPGPVYEKISREIQAEDLQRRLEAEAAKKFAVFHVIEKKEHSYYQVERGLELLDAARLLRSYLRGERGADRFGQMLHRKEDITPNVFDGMVEQRLENTGKVTGAFELNFDKQLFSAVHIMDGWQTYSMGDVSTAVWHADRKHGQSSERRWEKLLDHLHGKEVTHTSPEPEETCGSRRLRKEDIVFSDEICEVDNLLNFSLYCAFNVDEVFGTHVETGENDDYLNVYANYDMTAGQVCDRLEITLCRGDGTDKYLCYKLDDAELAALESRMEGYCYEQTGMGLKEYSAQFMAEEQAPPQPTMQM